MTNNSIKCPNCGTQINVDEIFTHQISENLQKDFDAKQQIANEKLLLEKKKLEDDKQKLEDWKKNEKENHEKLAEKIRVEETEKAKKSADELLKSMQEMLTKKDEEINLVRKKEFELLNQQNELKIKAENLELEVQKQVLEKQKELEENISKQEQEKSQLKFKELEKKLSDQSLLIDEMKRKANQGSMQIQGEVLELEVENYLKEKFRLDEIIEVQKGMRGADCIQIIHTQQKQNCGKIIYECKSAKAFGGEWIEKLKDDKLQSKSDIAVLVTTIYPKDMERMGLKDGVWICNIEEFKGLSIALREGLININNTLLQQQNKGDKVTMLYDYLVGNEFKSHIEAIVEAFSEMKTDLDKEKKYFLRIWKEREYQIEKVVNNTIQLYGSIKGIGGKEIMNIEQLELPE